MSLKKNQPKPLIPEKTVNDAPKVLTPQGQQDWVNKENKQINATLSGFKLDLLENGFDDLSSDLYEKLGKMNSIFTIKQKEEHLKQLETVTMKIVAEIEQVFGQPSKVKRKNWTQDEIELDEKFVRLTQKEQMPDELMDEQPSNDQPSNEKETYSTELSARFWGVLGK